MRRRTLLAVALAALMLAPIAAVPATAYPNPTWSNPTRMNPDTQNESREASVWVAEDGSANVLSYEDNDTIGQIVSNRFVPGLGWLPKEVVAQELLFIYPGSLHSAANRRGDVAAGWFDIASGSFLFRGAYYEAGRGWSPAVNLSVNASSGTWYSSPQLAVDENGDAIMAWITRNSTSDWVSAARYIQGQGWLTEERIHVFANLSGISVDVVFDAFGTPTVLWSENNNDYEPVYASTATGPTTWSSPVEVFPATPNGAPRVWEGEIKSVGLPNGDLLVTFHVDNASGGRIWYALRSGSSWTTGIISDGTLSTARPRLVMAADGTATLAFWQNSRMAVKQFTSEDGWGETTNVTGSASIGQHDIRCNLAGQLMLVWAQYTSGTWHTVAADWSPWAGWSPARTIDPTSVSSNSQWPSAGIDAQGNGFAVWVYDNGTSLAPWVSRYRTADPNPLPLTVTSPRNRESVGIPTVVVEGLTAPGASIEVNGIPGTVQSSGRFAVTVPLQEGWNFLTLDVKGRTGPTARQHLWVAYSDPARARANETADRQVDGGWRDGHSVGASTKMTGIYGAPYGDSIPAYSVSVGAGGDGAAFWLAINGSPPYTFYAAAYLNGSGWQTPHLISADGNPPWYPDIVTDASGRSTLVFQRFAEGKNSVWAAQYDPDTGWGPTIDLAPEASTALRPRAAIGTTGEVFVTFRRDVSPSFDFVVKRYTPSGGWQPTVVVDSLGTTGLAESAIAVTGANTVVAAWAAQSGGVSNVSAYRYTASTGWSAASTAVPDGPYVQDLRAVIDSAGEATLVYRTTPATSSTSNLTAVRSDNSNSWGTPVEIDGLSTPSPVGWRLAIGVDGQGDVTVMFLQSMNGADRALANRYVKGTGWTGIVTLDADSDSKGWVHGGVSPDGTVVAAWHHLVSGVWHIETATYLPGYGWQDPEVLPLPSGYARDPLVAVTTDGRALAIALHWPSWPSSGPMDILGYTFSPPDVTPPSLLLSTPTNGSTVTDSTILVSGVTEPGAQVFVNNQEAVVFGSGYFGVWVTLVNGTNYPTIVARDPAGNTATVILAVTYDDPDRRRIEQVEAEQTALWQALADQNASLLAELAAQNASLLGQIASLNASLLAEMAAGDATLAQLIADTNASLLADLATLNSDLTQAIAAQNASLLAQMAAGDAALAAQIAQTNATLFAELAALDSSLLQALADQNATLLAQMAAGDQSLADLIASTNASLLAQLAAQDVDLRDAIASANSSLLAALALQNDELLQAIATTNASLLEELAAGDAALLARLTADDAALWDELNATAAEQRAGLQGTQSGLDQTNSSLTRTQDELGTTTQSAATANTMALLGIILGAVGLALGAMAFMMARRRPPMHESSGGGSLPPVTPGGAEEVEVEDVGAAGRPHGHSMGAEGELPGTFENDKE